jgi:hypothetical protein
MVNVQRTQTKKYCKKNIPILASDATFSLALDLLIIKIIVELQIGMGNGEKEIHHKVHLDVKLILKLVN